MYIVIAGCGRVGSSLTRQLLSEGHDVCVIDESPESLSLLGDDFSGQFVIGQAIDWETLRQARLGEARPPQGLPVDRLADDELAAEVVAQ